ncbi:MAG TPA: DUF6798 domain-containing protein [Candidatus Eisenbacteria bacterium]|nr:DUF6798 domain-containing protein [Candidatus Eisenbacteria bacterium]
MRILAFLLEALSDDMATNHTIFLGVETLLVRTTQAGYPAAPMAESVPHARSSRSITLTEIALILALFAVYASWPVPEGNETCYLGKAKHFWNPAWGEGVLFMESGNAHAVFYVLTGWIACLLPLDTTAWIVRGSIWLLLAAAWQRFSFSVLPRRGAAVVSAALFLALLDRGNMAGEWIVGGAEAKGFAYALVLVGLERLARDDARRALPAFGLATSFHPLVGGWALVAGTVASATVVTERRRLFLPLLVSILFALPGLWGAMRLNAGTSTATITRAAEILVFERTSHHLLPAAFSSHAIVRHLCLWGAWFWLLRVIGSAAPHRLWPRFITAAIGISALGLLLWLVTSHRPPLAATILQYYWFRLADAMVPAGLAAALLLVVDKVRGRRPAWARALFVVFALFGTLHLAQRVTRIRDAETPRSDGALADPTAWRAVCDWVAGHTPDQARFLTPAAGASFLWYSGRRDIVNWKDQPQDAAAVVAWWECMRDIHGEGSAAGPRRGRPRLNELSASRLRELSRTYHADYAIVDREGHQLLDLPLVYENTGYLVYRFAE